jgi:nucleotide sugar dehydrogenase
LFQEPALRETLRRAGARFRATKDLKEGIIASEVVLVCVGTRRYADRKPDLRVVRKIVGRLGEFNLKGKLIVFKTTLPVGATRGFASQLERSTGLKCDNEFYVAFCPERIVEGKAIEETEKLPKIIGPIGPKSLRVAMRFYKTIGGTLVPVQSVEAAEIVKLIDNAYRITRFAFANEVALLAEANCLNAYELISAANRDYPRNDIPFPSCGVGGYCLTKDPWYLEQAFVKISAARGFHSIWLYARKVNDYMINSTADRIELVLAHHGVAIEKSQIGICGVAYKANVDDIRDSHGLFLAEELCRRGARVKIWDPLVTERMAGDIIIHTEPGQVFRNADLVVFTVNHRKFHLPQREMGKLVGSMRTRIVFDGASVSPRIRGNGIVIARTGVAQITHDAGRK